MENNIIQISEEEFLGMYSDVVASGEDMLAWKCPGAGYNGTSSFKIGDINGDGYVHADDARLWLRHEDGVSGWNDSGTTISEDTILAHKAAISNLYGYYYLTDEDLASIKSQLIENGYSGTQLTYGSPQWYGGYVLAVSAKLITQRNAMCINENGVGRIYNLQRQ